MYEQLMNAMVGYQPQNVPALPEGHTPNPAAPVIRNDPQAGAFGGLGFQPMSQEGLAALGISNPFAMEFRTPRYDQPFTPFGMHTLDPFGYQQQFPSVGPQDPTTGGPGPTPDRPPRTIPGSDIPLEYRLPTYIKPGDESDIARWMATTPGVSALSMYRYMSPSQRDRFQAYDALQGG